MFHSFFPQPRLFFLSFAAYAVACVVLWFLAANGWGELVSLGGLVGFGYPEALAEGADEAAQAAFADAQGYALNFWFYQYFFIVTGLFIGGWARYSPHPWARWSVFGSAAILIGTWITVQLNVMINNWFGTFYDLIQKALAEPNSISLTEYYGVLGEFLIIALAYVVLFTILHFFSQHFVFRWRTAMNDYYTSIWPKVRKIEGASQRIQEDTQRFASIMETLGTAFIDSVMTLIAFLPLLWALSAQIGPLPVVGDVPGSLVWVALIWSLGGTLLLVLVGIKLPGIYFRIQREEAAYRKELVIGEDNVSRAELQTLGSLFHNVRLQYFTLYFHYLYFNATRIVYLQISVLVPYVALAPSIIAAGITLGLMQQVVRAFNQVENSFQFLVRSWSTIVELLSIHKRLAAFERAIRDQPLEGIEREAMTTPAQ
ncbi:MAG: peptide antibiotic transporter SbmA [Pseudomonadota bacterium]